MASMQGRFRPSHNPKPHMLAGPLCAITQGHKNCNIIKNIQYEVI
jgi:hypothetical protein